MTWAKSLPKSRPRGQRSTATTPGYAREAVAAQDAAAGAGAADRTDVDAADVARFVERLGSTLTALGLQRVPSRVFAALMADDDGRMTAAELGSALGVSPASISGAVRYLSQVRMIHREREPGTRRDVFVVADDQWHETLLSADQIYGRLQAAFAEGVPVLGGSATAAGRRVALSVDFLDFLMEEMAGIADRWERRGPRL